MTPPIPSGRASSAQPKHVPASNPPIGSDHPPQFHGTGDVHLNRHGRVDLLDAMAYARRIKLADSHPDDGGRFGLRCRGDMLDDARRRRDHRAACGNTAWHTTFNTIQAGAITVAGQGRETVRWVFQDRCEGGNPRRLP